MRPRGVLITLEGLDGTGKSTQARMLVSWLRRRGLPVEHTREPGGTAVGRRLRRLLLYARGTGAAPVAEAELLLMMADRAQHVAEVLRPALEKGTVVVCERYADSSVAYQAFGCGMDPRVVEELNEWATGGLQPDLTLWLDLPVERRYKEPAASSADRFEARGTAFLGRVRQGYAELARRYPQRIVRVDAAGKSRQAVHAEIREAVEQRLGDRLRELGWWGR